MTKLRKRVSFSTAVAIFSVGIFVASWTFNLRLGQGDNVVGLSLRNLSLSVPSATAEGAYHSGLALCVIGGQVVWGCAPVQSVVCDGEEPDCGGYAALTVK
jgi:hypothetical protein